ncbi:hypothetical protein [Gryllotalpicola koreensis]|uniref:Uncharacterized protein n=1 Tax=Gryllotalpicola koreensis TaxID=993086 RepID=A0ABP7ZV56_9MICO
MTVYVDPSSESFVYGCTDCPFWLGIALTRDAADNAIISHEEALHGTQLARRARDRRHARRAASFVESSRNGRIPPA